MKITLTEKGVDFRNKLLLESVLSENQPGLQRDTVFTGRPHSQFAARLPVAASKTRHNLHAADPLERTEEMLNKLLPAILSASPPKQVRIRQPTISVSHQFLHKYVAQADGTPVANRSRAMRCG